MKSIDMGLVLGHALPQCTGVLFLGMIRSFRFVTERFLCFLVEKLVISGALVAHCFPAAFGCLV